MSQEKINTAVINQFIHMVKGADLGHQRELRIDIATAKNLSYTLALVMTRLAGDYETLLTSSKNSETVSIDLNGGSWT